MLEDLVYPAEIVGKRTRYRIDGSKISKVTWTLLSQKEQKIIDGIVCPITIISAFLMKSHFVFILSQIFLDPKERNNTEYKLESYAGVYRKLTGKDVVFDFPVTEAWRTVDEFL